MDFSKCHQWVWFWLPHKMINNIVCKRSFQGTGWIRRIRRIADRQLKMGRHLPILLTGGYENQFWSDLSKLSLRKLSSSKAESSRSVFLTKRRDKKILTEIFKSKLRSEMKTWNLTWLVNSDLHVTFQIFQSKKERVDEKLKR